MKLHKCEILELELMSGLFLHLQSLLGFLGLLGLFQLKIIFKKTGKIDQVKLKSELAIRDVAIKKNPLLTSVEVLKMSFVHAVDKYGCLNVKTQNQKMMPIFCSFKLLQ